MRGGGRAASPRPAGLGSGPLAWRRCEGVDHGNWLDDPKAIIQTLALDGFGWSRRGGTVCGCGLWSSGRGLRCHRRDLGSRIDGRSLGLQGRSGVARRERPPGLNQLQSMHLLRKWNVHLMRSVTVQWLSGMSPGEAGGLDRAKRPRQGRVA